MNKYLVAKEKMEMPVCVTVLVVAGWISLVVGLILGIINGEVTKYNGYYDEYEKQFSFGVCIIWWAAGVASWLTLTGFAKIIELLTKLVNKDYVLTDEAPQEVREKTISPDGYVLKYTVPATDSLTGSPVQLVSGKLFLHLANTAYIAMLNFKNSEEKTISAVEFEIAGLDDNSQVVETLQCEMKDLNAAEGMTFGGERIYKFSGDKDHIRKIEVNIKSVTFDDGSEWEKA